MSRFRARSLLAILLVATLGLRLIHLDQPIVENYVGRQIPTAMVARNLERGSGFFHPSLDVAPFPNLFLVEPPIYASLVDLLRRLTGLPLTEAGRAVSALGITFGAWGLYGLVARRSGVGLALISAAIFAVFPVTIRYGRAFQPDALMLGFLLSGLRFWDEGDSSERRSQYLLGWSFLAVGLALKITSAFVLVPLILILLKRRLRPLILAVSALLPALCWYSYAWLRLDEKADSSQASAENARIWLSVLIPWALLRSSTYANLFRFLIIRAFTPLGVPLALAGLWSRSEESRLWRVWGVSALAVLAFLAAKLHHEYYMLILTPVIAVGCALQLRSFFNFGQIGKVASIVGTVALATASGFYSRSTWATPREWSGIESAGLELQSWIPTSAWIVAPEALIFSSDRKGCRMEYTAASARRAAREWGETSAVETPLDLIEFYHGKGARFFADLAFEEETGEALALHRAVRGRYKIVIDRPGLLVVDLNVLLH